ncbi:MAG: hypothetical protein HZB46_11135 [Solirubrobacterales bacterium]|nr:hypothetical protein [Solirubrobacterales bacterium]
MSQGLTKGGDAVLPERSDPTDALGVAENDPNTPTGNVFGSFFSLGCGGSITLGFDNNICNATGNDLDLGIIEATEEPYAIEKVDVYVSKDGVSWVQVGDDVARDAEIALPASITIARYVRLVDASNPANFPRSDADGYDVDGVRALNTNCTDQGWMTGGGSLKRADGSRVTHGLGNLKCDGSGPTTLQVNWGGNRFHATALTRAYCFDDPAIAPPPPAAGFDTFVGTATGSYNGVAGATAEFTFTDAGEPGTADTGRIVIRDKDGNVVLDVATTAVDRGNQQAHG